MPIILITGAGGQLGRDFIALADQYPGLQLLPVDRAELDITRANIVRRFFDEHDVQYCINCAAYTAVDKAETHQEEAQQINVEGVSHLATVCAGRDIPLLHYSTDYVYHTNHNRPYEEDAPTLPQGVYAQTKLAGEQAARQLHPQTMIIRTSWVYSSFGHNFVRTMLRLGRQRETLRVVYDQIGAPTYARHLAQASLDIITKVEQQPALREKWSGIFHYSNEGVCSWYDLALAVFELSGIDCRVEPIETKDYPLPAPRPFYSVLNKTKIRTTFDLDIPYWRDGLKACLRLLE